MLKKRKLFLALTLLVLSTSCSTPVKQKSAEEAVVSRAVASSNPGITYPAQSTFDLRNNFGKTYANFMKKKIKPALDKLSDTANGGGGGFDNIGGASFASQSVFLDKKTFLGYKGAKYNRTKKVYEGALSDDQVIKVYDSLKVIKPKSSIDTLTYYVKEDKEWFLKNDMALALKNAKVNAAPFDLATLYALTGGIGVKVKLDDNNYNYHVLYKTGHTDPDKEVMSGRSFASSPSHGAADATDPEYLKDLRSYFSEAQDIKPFYRAMILALANSDTSGWKTLSDLGQSVLSDFLTVYTAESDRHLMVNLQDGNHPWEIDLAAVTFVSLVSAKTGKVVTDGELVDSDIGGWFAPSKHNLVGGPQRSGIGITRKDRQKFQRAIHAYEMTTPDGKKMIADIQAIIGKSTKKNKAKAEAIDKDVIQGVFEFLSNPATPESIGSNATTLADLMAKFIEAASDDSDEILKIVPSTK